jgi:hypothetical protein
MYISISIYIHVYYTQIEHMYNYTLPVTMGGGTGGPVGGGGGERKDDMDGLLRRGWGESRGALLWSVCGVGWLV